MSGGSETTTPDDAGDLPASRAPGARGAVEVVEPSAAERNLARLVAESKATVPHVYLQAEFDMGACERLAAEVEPGATPVDMVVKACAIALRRSPRANAAYRDARFELYSRVNIGLDSGIPAVPVIHDADRKDLAAISAERRELQQRAANAEITRPELSGGTFTLATLDVAGVVGFAPIIHRGQAAILAVGPIEDRPTVRDGGGSGARILSATLCCDQRILQPGQGAEFLADVRKLLQEAGSL